MWYVLVLFLSAVLVWRLNVFVGFLVFFCTFVGHTIFLTRFLVCLAGFVLVSLTCAAQSQQAKNKDPFTKHTFHQARNQRKKTTKKTLKKKVFS